MGLTSFRGGRDGDIHKYINMPWVHDIKVEKSILDSGRIGGRPLKCAHAFPFFAGPPTTLTSLFLTNRLKSLTF
jgi:hypothetical protein